MNGKSKCIRDSIPYRSRVNTPDGIGETIGMEKRCNGKLRSGRYIVRLDDGRIRHYDWIRLSRIEPAG